jgi:hypothetical protein
MMTSHPHLFRVYWPATLVTGGLAVVVFVLMPVLILVRVLPALGPEAVGSLVARIVPPPPGETTGTVIGLLVLLLGIWAFLIAAARTYIRILIRQYSWYAERGEPIGQLTAFVLYRVERLDKTHPDEFSGAGGESPT